ncbi:hypothetical protein D3C74_349410 [compost metagenome]
MNPDAAGDADPDADAQRQTQHVGGGAVILWQRYGIFVGKRDDHQQNPDDGQVHGVRAVFRRRIKTRQHRQRRHHDHLADHRSAGQHGHVPQEPVIHELPQQAGQVPDPQQLPELPEIADEWGEEILHHVWHSRPLIK